MIIRRILWGPVDKGLAVSAQAQPAPVLKVRASTRGPAPT